MDSIIKSLSPTSDIALGELLSHLGFAPELPLIFTYEGKEIKGGYHVTEIKAGQFSALDCGANPEAWSEIFVQLWDVEDRDRSHMTAGKFAAIVRRVSEHVGLDRSAKLTFEVSDGVRPMQLFCADIPRGMGDVLRVDLVPRRASCKPRDRWLAEQAAKALSCCTPSKGACCA